MPSSGSVLRWLWWVTLTPKFQAWEQLPDKMSQRLVLGADPAWLMGMITTEFPSFPALFWSTNGLMDDQPHTSLHSLSQSLHKYSAFVPALLFGSDEQKRTCYPLSLTRICLLSCDLHWNCPRTASFFCNTWKGIVQYMKNQQKKDLLQNRTYCFKTW